ncbi:MAG: discoidin domain-containing protein, partial [Armatimonadota bacterium]|nr:discoidin domain-containing protein [Armatimonadota bacterium]
ASYSVDGNDVLSRRTLAHPGPLLNVFRAFTDNDIWFQKRYWDSGIGSLEHRPVSVNLERLGSSAARVSVNMQVRGFKGTGFDQLAQYTVLADGSVVIDNSITPFGNLPPLPKMGLILSLGDEFDDFSWFGRGPIESYPDRKSAVDVGLYKGKVAAQFQEYVRPQENGNKEDVRWGALTNAQGIGILFQASGHLAMTVSRFRPEEIDNARHENGEPRKYNRLSPRPDVTVSLDAQQMGLGGASCGPGPMEQYLCMPKPVQFRVTMRPVRSGDDLRALGRLQTPVPLAPVMVRGDDGVVTVSASGALVIEIDGNRVDGSKPIPLAGGGTVRAYTEGNVSGPAVQRRFDKVVPVARIPVDAVETSSFEGGEGEAENAFDDDPSTYWHTEYSGSTPKHPHSLTVRFERMQTVVGFDYLARQANGNGRVGKFRLEYSLDGAAFTQALAGEFSTSLERQRIFLPKPIESVIAVRFVALSEVNGGPWASVAEVAFLNSP